jgi:hypothetical protein
MENMNFFKKISGLFKEEDLSVKSLESENQEIISTYRQIRAAVPSYDEPNYTLAEKVFRDFNDFDLKNIDGINNGFVYDNIPKSLLPYPKNYIKCAYYIFRESAKKNGDIRVFDLIQTVGESLFFRYPDYDQYKINLIKAREWEPKLTDKNGKKRGALGEAEMELVEMMKDGRETFKKLFGVYEVSESDYYSSPVSEDSTEEKLIHDFGVLPEIEGDIHQY